MREITRRGKSICKDESVGAGWIGQRGMKVWGKRGVEKK